tara:strand:- start:155 stop:352 length:198 start_codon:yes stop_codon:yes gene_type:complete
MKYITVLDFEDGKVYQYENLEHLKDGWNMDENDDSDVIEWYLDSLGHKLSNIEWMVHENNKIITN